MYVIHKLNTLKDNQTFLYHEIGDAEVDNVKLQNENERLLLSTKNELENRAYT